MHQYLEIAAELGLTPFNMVLIVFLYFMGVKLGIFPKLWGGSIEENQPATRAQMERLSNYYNHDTTALLTSIDGGIKEIKTAVEKVEYQIKELHITHAEWEKFGIPARIKKDL